MSAVQARRLSSHLRDNGYRAQVRRHSVRSLARARSLESFVRPFADTSVVYDPTGVFGRAHRLVRFATELRRLFPRNVKRVLWQGKGGVLFIVLSRPFDQPLDAVQRQSAETVVRTVLLQACGAQASEFVKSIRIGLADPRTAATPVDTASAAADAGPLARLRDNGLVRTLAAAAGLAFPGAAAFAQEAPALPAVSGLNGELGVIGGERDGSAAIIVEGAMTIPVGDQYGMRVDGMVGSVDGEALGGGAAHFFWRDPDQGLFGVAAGFLKSGDTLTGLAATESEVYFGDLTLSGTAGYQFSDSADYQGVLGRVDLEWYATDDLMFSTGLETNPQQSWLARGGLEYRPGFEALPGLTLFAEGALGENNYHRAYVGLRFYFGDSETLKDRHRNDTFRTHLLPTRMVDGAGGASIYGN